MSYVELHARSAFSFLEGASLPEALAAVASGMNISGMALLDRNGFYGSPRFHMAAKQAGIRAHVGTELTVVDEPPAEEAADEESLKAESELAGAYWHGGDTKKDWAYGMSPVR